MNEPSTQEVTLKSLLTLHEDVQQTIAGIAAIARPGTELKIAMERLAESHRNRLAFIKREAGL